MIVAFCGIDGAGKTSIITEIKKWLSENDYSVKYLKAVKGTSTYCKNFDKIVESYKDMFSENLPGEYGSVLLGFQLFQESEKLKRQKNKYDIILLDRWTTCHEAYSYAYIIKNKPLKSILKSCLTPDLTFLIDVDLETALKRVNQREVVKKQESYPILKRARKKYLKIAEENLDIITITNEDGYFNEAVEQIKKVIMDRIKSP